MLDWINIYKGNLYYTYTVLYIAYLCKDLQNEVCKKLDKRV